MQMRQIDGVYQPIPTESVEQQHLFQWAKLQQAAYPELALLYHVPNGGKRNRTTAARLKAEGVKPGVPDICLPVPRGEYHGLYIELKRLKGGTTSGDQKDWLDVLRRQGYYTAVCKGWHAAAQVILDYLKMEV